MPFPKPAHRAMARRRDVRKARAIAAEIRAAVASRDGFCRLSAAGLGFCRGRNTWAHLGDTRRFKTRGRSARERHTTAGTVMLCLGHHQALDSHAIRVELLTAKGANGPLRWLARGLVVYDELTEVR